MPLLPLPALVQAASRTFSFELVPGEPSSFMVPVLDMPNSDDKPNTKRLGETLRMLARG